MASTARRLPANAPGPFFVDETCIDCGVCRHLAPECFGATADTAIVTQQPATEAEGLAGRRALLSCPVGSIGEVPGGDLAGAMATLPLEVAPDVFAIGYTSRDSFGAMSWLIRAPEGGRMIDAPRWNGPLARRIEALGGVRSIHLTHRDDVADAARYAAHFGAERAIHAEDAAAQPYAERVLEGSTFAPDGDFETLHVPGHTRGHLAFLWRGRFLFTGDHLAWSWREKRLTGFRSVCWYSWEEQIRSMERLAELEDVEWILPGHGMWRRLEPGSFPGAIRELVGRMRALA